MSSLLREEVGNASVAASASTVNVTFAVAFLTTPDIAICNNPRNVSYWLTSITVSGFTLNLGSANPSTSSAEVWRYRARGYDVA